MIIYIYGLILIDNGMCSEPARARDKKIWHWYRLINILAFFKYEKVIYQFTGCKDNYTAFYFLSLYISQDYVIYNNIYYGTINQKITHLHYFKNLFI